MIKCPRCESTNVKDLQPNYFKPKRVFKCLDCLYAFGVDVEARRVYDWWKDQR
jgi:transposase-like protein